MARTGSEINKMPRLNIITGCVLGVAGLVAIFWIIPFHIDPQEVDRYVNSPKFSLCQCRCTDTFGDVVDYPEHY